MKILGLVVVLTFSVLVGIVYWQNNEWESQSLPASYKVLDDLETKGLYQDQNIKFKSLDGEIVPLEQLKGKIVILSFWATWCPPCVEEFPSFIKLLDTYPEKVVVVAISQDTDEKDVRDFIAAFKGQRQNLLVTMDANKALGKAFGVGRLPEGYIFDSQGLLVKKIIGIQDWASEDAIRFFKTL